ncbi:OmpA family protein [Colwellia sp. E2M01]|uniref:OmpA family protein n=1 Tax=Colwellia sp. E2M01 TaxID=2841561 RepID=UPI001C080C25|nr:OmpA family protein [Colwellia sp. E2M01]MBU2870745.1 OmpA family protein [Colwellia sp. E2M01]
MKVFKITLLAALISSPLAAQEIDKTWEVGVVGEYIKSATAKEWFPEWDYTEAGRGLGINLAKVIDEDWRARVEVAMTRYEINDGWDNDNGMRYSVDGLYSIYDTGLYGFVGMSHFSNAKSYNAVNLGLGYELDVSDRFALYSEGVVYRDVNNGETDLGFKIGLTYAFGKAKKAAKPTEPQQAAKAAPAAVVMSDQDNDGVVDSKDNCNNTPANVKVDSMGCTLHSEETVELNLNVAFANNSAVVEPAMMTDIQRLADFMMEYQDTNVEIEGHSSAVGNAQYNLVLSQKRADAIKDILIRNYGISASRLSAVGYGETNLISKGNTKADHEQNRRVIVKIEKTIQKAVTKN